MGDCGYICDGCGLSIRTDEKAVLRHIRHGQVLGEARGTYNGYGGVVEDDSFCNGEGDIWGSGYGNAWYYDETADQSKGASAQPNNHRQLWLSQYQLEDSKGFIEGARLWNGKPLDWMAFRATAPAAGIKALSPEMYDLWEKPTPYREVHPQAPRSGAEAWHTCCFDRAAAEAEDAHVISEDDPDQS